MNLPERLLDLAVAIQQIPAPTFQESARAQFLLEQFRAEGLRDTAIDSTGNVYARLQGGRLPALVVSAHLDTVFPAETPLTVRREAGRLYGPGIGDNALGVAALFGLVWLLREREIALPGDLWLAANVCEEGLGDLKGMKAICDRFGDAPLGYLVLEGMALGHVYHRGTGVRRYRISVHTTGGHSWTDFGRPSAIHELVQLAAQLTILKVPATPRTTFNIGRIGGGTSINTIAPHAWLELDLRSDDAAVLQNLARRVEALLDTAQRPGIRIEAQVIGQRPAGEMPASHPFIQRAIAILRELGIEPALTAGSTDANIPLSRGYPALVLGITRGEGAHTTGEYIETGPVEDGLEQLVRFVSRAWD
ncbi:MAG: M20/M25/M40 family metallo-hydrolase [Anaerolineales bacterium]|nr:M20/M25/M40 family metallo-hydrolase [Anaerolineales bacterium]MDW8276414.1 M20/M25/M40 family metallo-hydrolase [Anaerolineales bacterium]